MDIVLPDGSVKQFSAPITGLELAASIGAGLAKAAVAVKVNNKQQDLSTTITENSTASVLTAKDAEGLDVMRHTLTAQVLARAVKDLYPSAKLAIGPTVDHGFYYDVLFENSISSEELPKIEARMREILKEGHPVHRVMLSVEKAKSMFQERNEPYKVQLIEEAVEKGENVDEISVYFQGEDLENPVFIDLCRGPHVPSLKHIHEAFTLTNLAGAYWKGDSQNEMLTRIYGVAFADKKELKAHLTMMEEAEKRDHRKLMKQLDLCHLQDEAPAQIFWHDKGWTIFLKLQEYIREKLARYDYQEVNTPQLVDSVLYKKSGHWDKFGTDEMFVVKEKEKTFAMKPMNCPCHVQIFNQSLKSYRELPLRISEFGTCMRNEAHGARHGMMRVTSMTQDDGHIFCTHQQIEEEVVQLCDLIKEIYADFGFTDVFVKLSTRPEMRVGSDKVWDDSEDALGKACTAAGLPWVLNPGEGAFYGPKLEFTLRDAIGREWQCGTIQLDFNMPERLGAEYVGEDGQKHSPVMIHRALLGSLERFTGILIEHFAGHFPLWLAPVQVVATGITEKQNDVVKVFVEKLKSAGIRAQADLRNEKVNYKIREHSAQKVPIIAVLGDREIEEETVTIRRLGSQQQTTLKMDAFVKAVRDEVASRRLHSVEGAETQVA